MSLTGKISSSLGKERTEEECREKVLASPGAQHLIPVLAISEQLLVIEDFHYLQSHVQRTVFQDWKAFVDDEVSVAVIGTTHHASDLAFANKDLIGRVAHLPMTTWPEKDLTEIARKGFKALNVELELSTMRRIASESLGLPLLTQAICLEITQAQNMKWGQQNSVSLNLTDRVLFRYLNNLANSRFSQFEAMYDRIALGLKNHKKKKYHTYEYLLSIFSLDPIVHKMAFPEIITRLDKLPVDKSTIPPPTVVKASLTRLSKLQEQVGTELLEFYAKDQALYIIDPSFLFYLRWRKQRTGTPSLDQIFEDLFEKLLRVRKAQAGFKRKTK